MDDRKIADTINTVRYIATAFRDTQQLRDRLAYVLIPPLKRIAELESERDELRKEIASAGDVLLEAGLPDDGPLWKDIKQLAEQRDAARREAAEAQALAAEAADDIASWGAYASEYFQLKHNLAGCVAKYMGAPTNALATVIEQARQEERAKIIERLGEMVDNARDNGYPLAVEALQEAIDMLDSANGKEG